MTASRPEPHASGLIEAMKRIAAGDFSTRLSAGAHDAPPADVAEVFNRMAENLQGTNHERDLSTTSLAADLAAAQKELERVSLTDPLTQVANSIALAELIRNELDASAAGGRPPALLALDLHSFREVNGSVGHCAGDEILQVVARRIRGAIRETDTLARIGGNEFAVLLPQSNLTRARRVANRLSKVLGETLLVNDADVRCAASVGLRVADSDELAETFLRKAVAAMEAARIMPTGNVKVFEPALLHAKQLQSDTISDLSYAIRNDQLVLYFQPVVELATGRIEGVEALVRWQHPERGLVMPDNFIPLAEETGLIVELGMWVLTHAVTQLSEWQVAGVVDSTFNMRVNISSSELRNLELIEHVRDALRITGVKSANLIIELTESMAINEGHLDQYSVMGLRRLGVQLEIDDFGTGYSSISYLRKLPVNVVKIDRSLITDLGVESKQEGFVAAVLQLIHSCGMKALAEGIETAEQAQILARMGCESGQGYLFGRPAAAADVVAMLGPAVSYG